MVIVNLPYAMDCSSVVEVLTQEPHNPPRAEGTFNTQFYRQETKGQR